MPLPTTSSSSHDADRLWFIDGKAYDLTDFLAKHPGGMDALGLGRGTDCTELFRCYHLRKTPPAQLMARYEVDVDRDDPRNIERLGGSGFTFHEGDFYKTIQGRARTYFDEARLTHRATGPEQWVAILILASVFVLAVPAYIQGSLLAALAFGFARGLASVNPGHSMSHFTLFPRGRWNGLAFHLLSPFLVSTWSIWTSTHVRSHHIDTLTAEDLQDNYPLKRVQPEMRHRIWHRQQHRYIWFIYLLSLPLWSAQDLALSVTSFFSRNQEALGLSPRERFGNVLALMFNLFVSVALPFFFLPFWNALAVCLLANAVCSLVVVLQIVVNHEVPETMGQTPKDRRGDWGAHQVLTSHNYGVDSWLALHLSGGLNMQIEHHLFPSVHYSHYPALSRIVRGACSEFGLPYNTSPSLLEALRKHHQLLATNSAP